MLKAHQGQVIYGEKVILQSSQVTLAEETPEWLAKKILEQCYNQTVKDRQQPPVSIIQATGKGAMVYIEQLTDEEYNITVGSQKELPLAKGKQEKEKIIDSSSGLKNTVSYIEKYVSQSVVYEYHYYEEDTVHHIKKSDQLSIKKNTENPHDEQVVPTIEKSSLFKTKEEKEKEIFLAEGSIYMEKYVGGLTKYQSFFHQSTDEQSEKKWKRQDEDVVIHSRQLPNEKQPSEDRNQRHNRLFPKDFKQTGYYFKKYIEQATIYEFHYHARPVVLKKASDRKRKIEKQSTHIYWPLKNPSAFMSNKELKTQINKSDILTQFVESLLAHSNVKNPQKIIQNNNIHSEINDALLNLANSCQPLHSSLGKLLYLCIGKAMLENLATMLEQPITINTRQPLKHEMIKAKSIFYSTYIPLVMDSSKASQQQSGIACLSTADEAQTQLWEAIIQLRAAEMALHDPELQKIAGDICFYFPFEDFSLATHFYERALGLDSLHEKELIEYINTHQSSFGSDNTLLPYYQRLGDCYAMVGKQEASELLRNLGSDPSFTPHL